MPNTKAGLSRRATLRDLHWFTITDDLDRQTHYTTWQAIAYLIRQSFSDNRILKNKYSILINHAEYHFLGIWGRKILDLSDQTGIYRPLRELFERRNGTTPKNAEEDSSNFLNNLSRGSVRKNMVRDFSNLLLADDGPFDEVIIRLDQWRDSAVGHLSLPDVLRTIFSHQIEEYRAGRKSALTIIEHRLPQLTRPIPLITKKSLDRWRALNIKSLKSLGWGDPDQERPSTRIREDALANNERVMAVMIRILAELFPKPFAKGGDPTNPNISAIEIFVGDNVDVEKCDFPKSRTRTSVLTQSHLRIADDKLLVHSPLRISKHHDDLSAHYKERLARRRTKSPQSR